MITPYRVLAGCAVVYLAGQFVIWSVITDMITNLRDPTGFILALAIWGPGMLCYSAWLVRRAWQWRAIERAGQRYPE